MSGRGSERLAGSVDLLSLLETGELEVLGLLPRASNFTFLVRVSGDGEQTLAVYKPRAGEAPLWDFPEGSLAAREVAAYVVASDLGWPGVPPTVLRDGPQGPGSVQRFVAFDPERHYLTMHDERPDDFRRVALFDIVVNNADRKSGHCLLGEDGELFVVDHGVCFHEEPKLRTVIWEFAGELIPPDAVGDLEAFRARLRGGAGAVRGRLNPLLSPAEIDALDRRLNDLLTSGSFPHPGPGRPFPWPVV